jgi:predicted DCC family thiol-disulfide oxidoreductase YuxK
MKETLYYDGKCSLCVAEMDKLAGIKGDQLDLQDIHKLSGQLTEEERINMLKVLHLQRGDQWITGIDANIAAWQHTRWGWIWRILGWPLIKPIANLAYKRWARWRYDRLYTK